MKQRLCIGIQQLDNGWSSILNQIGVWFEQVDYTKELPSHYSVIILNKRPDSDQAAELHSFLKQGGALLELKGVHPFLHSHLFKRKHTSTLFKETQSEIFQHIPALDIHAEAEFHKESRLFKGLVHFQVWKKGLIGFFGVDLPELLQRIGYKRKRFYGNGNKHPDEIVSTTSKHELIQAFSLILRELHFRRSIPFIQKWNSPKDSPVFAFRIDTDFGDSNSIQSLYTKLSDHEIKGTWFLHVEAHEDWLSEFKAFAHQELAFHGYKHGTSSAISRTRQNISTGMKILKNNDISVNGFCAPYGIWNKALERALDDFEFQYTSEFTYLYDGYPFRPVSSNPLQIPVHPICTGSLNRRQYNEAQMAAYFSHILEKKLGRHEPVVFYHHPLQPGLKVWDHLFEQVNTKGLTMLTFKEFADFWEKRDQTNFEGYLEGNEIQVESNATSLLYQVATEHSGFTLMKANTSLHLQKNNDFQYSNSYLPETEVVQYLHQNDLKLMKTSLFDWKNRNRL